jgi:hypothetical protein
MKRSVRERVDGVNVEDAADGAGRELMVWPALAGTATDGKGTRDGDCVTGCVT